MADFGQSSISNVSALDQETVYYVLMHPSRRRILRSLALNGPQTADSLRGSDKLTAMIKHLTTMREAGLVTRSENPDDGRRYLYALTSAVPVEKTDQGANIDFGFCLFRYRI